MRTKAEKLEKGKWYADMETSDHVTVSFLRFENINKKGSQIFDRITGYYYKADLDGKWSWDHDEEWYLPTPEDIEKYGLIDDEI